MIPKYRKVHSRFKLNGLGYSEAELHEVAYSLIKEGAPYEKQIGDFLLYWLDGSESILVQTSGSTGTPKTLALKKRHMVNSAFATGDFFGLGPGDSALLCLPVNYIAGKMMLVRAMVLGLELDYTAPSSDPLEGVAPRYNFSAMVPLQLERTIKNIGRIRTLIVGGAPLSHKLREKLGNQLKQIRSRMQSQGQYGLLGTPIRPSDRESGFVTDIYETYGMTETCTHIALKKVGGSLDAKKETSQSYFKTLPEISVSLDTRGCLVVHAQNILDAPVVTNDLVHLISKTEFEYLGRYDNVVNSGGVKLFPEQLEAHLEPLMDSRFFLAGLPDDRLGQELVLVVEGNPDKTELSSNIESLSSLERFQKPRKIFNVDEFAETKSGKIKRSETIGKILYPN